MQQISSTRVAELICDFLLGNQTDADRNMLDSWLSASESNRNYFNDIKAPANLKTLLEQPRINNLELGRSIWRKICRGIAQSQSPSPAEHSITSVRLPSLSNYC